MWGSMMPVATCDLCLTLNLNQAGSYFQSICHHRRQQKDMDGFQRKLAKSYSVSTKPMYSSILRMKG